MIDVSPVNCETTCPRILDDVKDIFVLCWGARLVFIFSKYWKEQERKKGGGKKRAVHV